ncbi:hypothetical protein [Catellatospora sichuanensis]|uniref:hypothetical protein n=1 Tax=Catellatospora sichuanensis TaxID=1969805 RepID=UPI001183CDF4|nr:hypothetical protein [Catellatospora sichuanensis]
MNGESDRQKSIATVVVAGLAACAAGIVLTRWGLAAMPQRLFAGYPGAQLAVGAFEPGVTALAAALTVLAAGFVPAITRLSGWAVSAAGALLTLAGLQFATPGGAGGGVASQALLAAGLGVMSGGLLLAAGQQPRAGRLATAGGFTAGLVLASSVVLLLAPRGYDPDALSPEIYLPGIALALAVAAAVAAMSRPVPAASPTASVWGPAVATAVAAAVLYAGNAALAATVDSLRLSRDGLASQRRIDFVQDLARYGMLAVAVAVGLVLTWYAYRRGRADLARWTVLCLALAAPLHMGLVRALYLPSAPYLMLLAALTAAALGVAAAVYADRWLPADALGICLAGAGIAVSAVAYRQGPSWGYASAVLIATGTGFALAAGLTRVLRTAAGAPVDVAGSALLGLGTVLLAGQALGLLTMEAATSTGYGGDVPLTLPGLSGALAVVLLLLFGLSRAVDRIRRDIQDEARRPVS